MVNYRLISLALTFVRDHRGVYDPEARYLAGNPWYPVTGQF